VADIRPESPADFIGMRSRGIPPGISTRLHNVQKLADGPRLKSARPDGSEFGKLPDYDDDLSSILN